MEPRTFVSLLALVPVGIILLWIFVSPWLALVSVAIILLWVFFGTWLICHDR